MFIDNCAPYDIVRARNEVLGVLEFKPEECIPMTENSIAAIISNIQQKFPKVSMKNFQELTLNKKQTCKCPLNLKIVTLTFYANIKTQSVLTNSIWAEQEVAPTIFT